MIVVEIYIVCQNIESVQKASSGGSEKSGVVPEMELRIPH